MKHALLLMAVIPWVIAVVVTMMVFFALRRRLAKDSIGQGASSSAVIGFILCVVAASVLGKWLLAAIWTGSANSGAFRLLTTLIVTVAFPLIWGGILILASRLLVRLQPGETTTADVLRDLGLGALPTVLVYPFIAVGIA